MLTLGLDTAGEELSLAVANGERPLVVIQARTQSHLQAEELLPALDALFHLAGNRPENLTQIAVAIGPGSYTGLRNGLTVAKTLAQLNDVPVLGVDNLTLLLARAEVYGLISPWLDIRRGEVYTMLINRSPFQPGSGMEILETAGVRRAEAWLEHLAARDEPVTLLGDAGEALVDRLTSRCPKARVLSGDRLAPSAGALIRLACRPELAGKELKWSDYRQIQPFYPDRPVAQETVPGRRRKNRRGLSV